jgi:hypothetical protein
MIQRSGCNLRVLGHKYQHPIDDLKMVWSVADKARTIMAQFNTPPKCWCLAVSCAAYVLDRTHITANRSATPLDMRYGEVSDVSHLVSFNSPGVFYLIMTERKNQSWAYNVECWGIVRYLNVRTSAIMSRADCVVDESLYEVLR